MFHRASSFPPSWLYIIVTFGSSLLIRERTVGWGAPKPHRPYKTSRLDLLTTRLGPVQCDLHSDLHTTFQCATTCNNVQHAMERLPHWNVSLPSAASIASLASISYNIISYIIHESCVSRTWGLFMSIRHSPHSAFPGHSWSMELLRFKVRRSRTSKVCASEATLLRGFPQRIKDKGNPGSQEVFICLWLFIHIMYVSTISAATKGFYSL
jgi:hypothetical protein